MKFRYDKTDDILMVWMNQNPVDYAEQSGNVIVHFDKTNKPVLLEILDAFAFLKATRKALPEDIKRQLSA